MALVGVRYIQDQDPGTPASGGYEWFRPSTNELFVRNGSNTAWTIQGNAGAVRLGDLDIAGGEMKGAITGDSGLTPINNPDMQTSATQVGKPFATVEDVKAVMESIRMDFEHIATGAINGATGGQSLVGKFVMGTAEVDSAAMSSPWFDITTAAPAPGIESWSAWIVGPTACFMTDVTSGGGTVTSFVAEAYGTSTTPRYHIYASGTALASRGKFNYLKIGVYS